MIIYLVCISRPPLSRLLSLRKRIRSLLCLIQCRNISTTHQRMRVHFLNGNTILLLYRVYVETKKKRRRRRRTTTAAPSRLPPPLPRSNQKVFRVPPSKYHQRFYVRIVVPFGRIMVGGHILINDRTTKI